MSDFITLQCPSCGGNLSVGTNTLSLKCEHCGAEHMIRRESGGIILESYARCPVCNRNDRVEKVTAILKSQSHNSQGITYQTQTTMVRIGNSIIPVNKQVETPVYSSQTSELAKNLTPPPQPVNNTIDNSKYIKNKTTTLGIITIILALISLCCMVAFIGAATSGDSDGSIFLLVFSILSFLLFTGLTIYILTVARSAENKRNLESKAIAQMQQNRENATYNEALIRWNNAMENWKKLYYCGRDDCVFLPGKNTSAPIYEMKTYIYRS